MFPQIKVREFKTKNFSNVMWSNFVTRYFLLCPVPQWLIAVSVILLQQIMYCFAENWNLVQMIGEFADTRDVYIGWCIYKKGKIPS